MRFFSDNDRKPREVPKPKNNMLSQREETGNVSAAITHYEQRLQQASKARPSLNTLFMKDNLRILSIGCGGLPIEIDAFAAFRKDKEFSYTGFDIDENEIVRCKEHCAANKIPGCQFFALDCTDYSTMWELLEKEPADIVVIRHPVFNVLSLDVYRAFQTILTKTAPYLLTENGCMLVSIYTEKELSACHTMLSAITTQPEQYFTLTPNLEAPVLVIENTLSSSDEYAHARNVSLHAEQYFFVLPEFTPSSLLKSERDLALQPPKTGSLVIPPSIEAQLPHLIALIDEADPKKIMVSDHPERLFFITRTEKILRLLSDYFLGEIKQKSMLEAIKEELKAWEENAEKNIQEQKNAPALRALAQTYDSINTVPGKTEATEKAFLETLETVIKNKKTGNIPTNLEGDPSAWLYRAPDLTTLYTIQERSKANLETLAQLTPKRTAMLREFLQKLLAIQNVSSNSTQATAETKEILINQAARLIAARPMEKTDSKVSKKPTAFKKADENRPPHNTSGPGFI